eukprot:1155691-Pelagomonas_calceolata.AAC.4
MPALLGHPWYNAIFGRDPAQAQAAAASVWEGPLVPPKTTPPRAHNKWPPRPSGHILGSTCRLGGAAGGLGHTGGEFGWLIAQTGRPSAQQASTNTNSSVLKNSFNSFQM